MVKVSRAQVSQDYRVSLDITDPQDMRADSGVAFQPDRVIVFWYQYRSTDPAQVLDIQDKWAVISVRVTGYRYNANGQVGKSMVSRTWNANHVSIEGMPDWLTYLMKEYAPPDDDGGNGGDDRERVD